MNGWMDGWMNDECGGQYGEGEENDSAYFFSWDQEGSRMISGNKLGIHWKSGVIIKWEKFLAR